MYDAKVFRVMTGAPSDIKEEINIVRKCVNEWNAVNSENKGIVVFPIHWENDCYPISGIAPQDHINKSLTDKSDMMICIFGARLGTPTKNETSGTVEELKKHISNNKPAMVYFKTSVRNLNDIQPEQLQKVKELKEEIKDKTFYREYRSTKDFKNRFVTDFELAVNNYFVNSFTPVQKRVVREAKNRKIISSDYREQTGKRPNSRLKIVFADGTVLEDFYACRTFVSAIQKIGVQRVMNLGIRRCRVLLVGREISDKYHHAQVSVGDGIWVLTHSSTDGKKRDLDMISQKLNLGLKVTIV